MTGKTPPGGERWNVSDPPAAAPSTAAAPASPQQLQPEMRLTALDWTGQGRTGLGRAGLEVHLRILKSSERTGQQPPHRRPQEAGRWLEVHVHMSCGVLRQEGRRCCSKSLPRSAGSLKRQSAAAVTESRRWSCRRRSSVSHVHIIKRNLRRSLTESAALLAIPSLLTL